MPRNLRKRRNRRRGPRTGGLLPLVQTQKIYSQVFRFRATGALSTTVFTRCLTNLYHVASTTTTSSGIIGAFRIRMIKVFAIADGGSNTEFNTVSLTYAGGLYGRNQEFTAAGSTAMPGKIIRAPPSQCSARFWHSVPLTGAISGNGEPLFAISSLGAGVIVDLSIDYTLCDGTSLPGSSLTVAAATAGVLYTNSLDNSTTSGSSGTNSLQPVARFFLLAFG